MNKLDLIKVYRAYFTAKAKPELVTIEEAHFIAIKGKGDPSAPTFAHNIEALYSIAYTTEPVTLKQIAAFCEQNKLAKNGLHHEIYLSDFRRTSPEKLKTILREPVK
jgi:hypothetical protein